MRIRGVVNIHGSNAHLSVLKIHTRLGISIRCAAHELSYINATSAKLVCMYTSINIVSQRVKNKTSLVLDGFRLAQSPSKVILLLNPPSTGISMNFD